MPRRERPLGPGDEVVMSFAAGLRELREAAGGPTYRELSTRAGYSAAALSDAAGGRKLPGLALTTAYVTACEGDIAEWEERWRAVSAELATEDDSDDAEDDVPYLGLSAFQPSDAGRFFGREKLVGELKRKVRQRRFVGVFGASGSGKSSVLRAGLAAEAGERWAMVFTPGEHPLEQCAAGLATRGHLLIIDQFEEVYTLCHDDAERVAFLDALLGLAVDGHGTQVVIGVRADFYGHCGRHAGLVEALRDAQVMVGPMTADELRTAIVEPAVRLGCRVEAALVTTLVADATGQPAVLPLVSHALLETWRRRQGITLTVAAYEAAGGIQNAIARTAEAAYSALATDRQAVVRQVFLRLTALGEGTEDTKRRLHRRELDTDDPATTDVLGRLADARLLALDRDGVEIAHEALIRSWPRLRDWLAEDREGHRLHRQLSEATDLWETLDRDPGSLYRGTRLALTAEWAERCPDLLSPREQAFLDAGLEAEAAEAAADRRRTRRLRRLVALLAVLVVLAGATTGYAINAEQTATDQRNVATARKVVGDAADLRTTNPGLSVQLSLAAYRLAPVQEARDSLLGALAEPFATRLGLEPDGVGHDDSVALSGTGALMVTAGATHIVQVWSIADPRHPALLATLPEAARPHYPVALSRDGRLLAVATGDTAFRLWDLRDPRRPVPRGTVTGHTLIVFDAEITADGRTLVTAGKDDTTRLDDISDPDHPKTIAVRTGSGPLQYEKVSLSPDGLMMAIANDRETQLWDIRDPRNPQPLSTFSGHADLVNLDAFSPDGKILASTGWDNTIRLWDISDPRNPRPKATLPTTAIVWMATFSPDGRTLATVGDDQLVRIWDVSDPAGAHALTQLAGHTNATVWAGFTPDGRTLVSAGLDESVRLQDMPSLDLFTRSGAVIGLTPDGHTLISGDTREIQFWSLAERSRPRQVGRIGLAGESTATTLSADGRTLGVAMLSGASTAVAQGLIQRWDIGDPAHPRLVAQTSAPKTYSMAFSADGRSFAAGYDNGPAAVWDVRDPGKFANPVALPMPGPGTVWSVHFTADSRTLVHTQKSAVSAVYLWDVSDPRHPAPLGRLVRGDGILGTVALSPDGRLLAVGDSDRTVYLWDITDPRHPVALPALTGHTDGVGSVQFDGTGTRIATGSADRSARLWDVHDQQHPAQTAQLDLTAPPSIGFGAGGRTVVVSGAGTEIWQTDPDTVAREICAIAAPEITPAEWSRYFPVLPYNPPCS